jgi:hypothetical protein
MDKARVDSTLKAKGRARVDRDVVNIATVVSRSMKESSVKVKEPFDVILYKCRMRTWTRDIRKIKPPPIIEAITIQTSHGYGSPIQSQRSASAWKPE